MQGTRGNGYLCENSDGLRRGRFPWNSLKRMGKRRWVILVALGALFLLWWSCLPRTLFSEPTSTVVLSEDGTLIGARIADDGQWRFPEMDSVPYRFRESILLFEDEYFYQHPGFNPISIVKALHHNLTRNSRRGGSTITQQLIRLMRKGKRRTYFEKIVELFMATRLELRCSKEAILKYYASHTPYGGNVVGLETASWRYYGVGAEALSWSQAATLAVLPNAPALIFPGTNDELLRVKRDRLLKKLLDRKRMDRTTYELALLEPLPGKPLSLPNIAPHLTERLKKERNGERVHTTIDLHLQQTANSIARSHYQRLKGNEVHNLAILVMEVDTRAVLAYVGNSPSREQDAPFVDIITKKRSVGSTLKPLLFAAQLHEGSLLPQMLLKDIPTVINGYEPKNFDKTYSGAVPANRALSRSLNVPAVRLLQRYGLEKFYNTLQKINFKALDRPYAHYGLPLVLGGAEASLWDITQTYAAMAATLKHYTQNSSQYRSKEFVDATIFADRKVDFGSSQMSTSRLGAGALYHTLEALRQVNRPEGNEHWEFFHDSQPIAWKTGTSFGFKDGWAVGVTPKYAIGVWAGNADGEGRPGLTGIATAAPMLFDVLGELPNSGWFDAPFDDLVQLDICRESGHRVSLFCNDPAPQWVPKNGKKSAPCPYHRPINLDTSERFQVTANCYPLEDIKQRNWFHLPPIMGHYYSKRHPTYQEIPPFMQGCPPEGQKPLQFIFPLPNETVLLPKRFGGKTGEVIFRLAHQRPQSEVFWYLDDRYLGTTETFHEMALRPRPGRYTLSVVDGWGNRLERAVTFATASE